MAKLRGPVVAALVLTGLVVPAGLAGLAAPSSAAEAQQSRVGLAICPNVTTTTELQTPQQTVPGCGSTVTTPNNISIDNGCGPPPANSDLGAFQTRQNPFGAIVWSGSPDNCASNPPTRGRGAGGARITVSVAQRGFCPTTLNVEAREGPIGGVAFPLGTLPFGLYDVTVTFPDQILNEPIGPVSWIGNHATGTLRVGTTFTETAMVAAARGSTFAALLDNSFAGNGAGRLLLTKSALRGTEYYGCGKIDVAARVTVGKHGRVRGRGLLTGGTGNYESITGTFALTGKLSAKTKRGMLVLKGQAGY